MLLREFICNYFGLSLRSDLGPRGCETGPEVYVELLTI